MNGTMEAWIYEKCSLGSNDHTHVEQKTEGAQIAIGFDDPPFMFIEGHNGVPRLLTGDEARNYQRRVVVEIPAATGKALIDLGVASIKAEGALEDVLVQIERMRAEAL